MEKKRFKSIHIDLEKGIFEINGEGGKRITELSFSWNPEDGFELVVSVDELYTSQTRNQF